MKMGELMERTGMGREAIRFYIKEGLLPKPEKPHRNSAIYSEDHVSRIEMIKRLKDERYLPLDVIRDILDNPDTPQTGQGNLLGLEFLLAARLGTNANEPHSAASLIEETSLTCSDLKDLQDDDLIATRNEAGTQILSGQDASLALIWAKLKNAGFNASTGFSPHDLQRYKDAAEVLAEIEIPQFFENLSGTRPADEAALMAETALSLVEQAFSIFHTKAVLKLIAARNADAALSNDTPS